MLSLFRTVLSPRNGRAMSSLINLSVCDKTGIAQVQMNNYPVNSLSTKLIGELLIAIDQVKAQKCRGMILTSGAASTFSAGLNFPEIYNAEMATFRKYWYLFQELNLQLYSAPFLTVAAITGHAPAGGCVISLTTDYRVMINSPEKPFRIGLNETAVGLSAPTWVQQLMTDIIGKRQTAQALLSSTLFTTEEAFKIGLVDEMGNDREEVLEKAESYLNMFQKLPLHALVETKLINRSGFINDFRAQREFDLLNFSNSTLSGPAQECLGQYLKTMKKK